MGGWYRNHAERRSKFSEVMHTDGGATTATTEGEMEFLLVVHESFDEHFPLFFVIRNVNAFYDRPVDYGSDGFEAGINGHGDATFAYLQVGFCRGIVEEISHGNSQGFSAEEVGSVGKDLDVQQFIRTCVNVGSQKRELFVDQRNIVFKSLLSHEGTQERLWHGDGWHEHHLANQ